MPDYRTFILLLMALRQPASAAIVTEMATADEGSVSVFAVTRT
jgi:hypothetical protein